MARSRCQCMDGDAGQAWVALVVIAAILLILSRFFLFPAVCQVIPLELPGSGLDFCVLFR